MEHRCYSRIIRISQLWLNPLFGKCCPLHVFSHSGPVVRQVNRVPRPNVADHLIERDILTPRPLKGRHVLVLRQSSHNVFRLLSPTLLHS